MSDIFNLPNNAQNFYRKGQNARDHGDYLQAIDYYEKSYALEEEFLVLRELVELYLMTAQTDTLDQLWARKLSQVPLDQLGINHILLYAHSLTYLYESQPALIELYQIKDHFLTVGWDPQPIDRLIQEMLHLKKVQDQVQQATTDQDRHHLIDQFLKGGSLNFLEQMKTLYRLKADQVQALLFQVLKREDVIHFVKGDILHYCIHQGIQGEVVLNWFQKDYPIHLEDLVVYKKDPTYQTILKQVEDYSQVNNPNLSQELINHLNLLIMVYFPFIDQAIPDPNLWVQLFLSYYDLEDAIMDSAPNTTTHYLDQAFREVNLLLQDTWTPTS